MFKNFANIYYLNYLQIVTDDLTIPLQTKADLALTTSMKNESFDLKSGDKFISRNFSQSYQIRNVLESPISGIKVEVDVPTHYAQKPITKYLSSVIQLNNGTMWACQKDTSTIQPAGKSDERNLPNEISCLVPGTRCINIT